MSFHPAMSEEMQVDENGFLMGEDVGVFDFKLVPLKTNVFVIPEALSSVQA